MRSDHCLLSWEPPKENGGTEVTGYYVERCLAGSSRWIKVAKDSITGLETRLDGLVEGNEYQFRIIAENKVGQGPPSSATKPCLAKDPWGNSYVINSYDNEWLGLNSMML